MPPAPPPPRVLSFVLCDRIEQDAHKKLYLLGLINEYTVDEFPAVVRDSWMYCALNSGHGDGTITFRITDAAELDAVPVISTDVPLAFANPLAVTEVALSYAALRFPTPGLYVWQLVYQGEVVFERRIEVRKINR